MTIIFRNFFYSCEAGNREIASLYASLWMISSKGVEASSPINSAALRLELKFMRLSPDPKDMGATIYNIS